MTLELGMFLMGLGIGLFIGIFADWLLGLDEQ